MGNLIAAKATRVVRAASCGVFAEAEASANVHRDEPRLTVDLGETHLAVSKLQMRNAIPLGYRDDRSLTRGGMPEIWVPRGPRKPARDRHYVPIPMPPPRILVADDDPIFRDAEETILFAAFPDAEFVVCVDGADALEHCLKRPFDLIVTDFKMPRMTGIEMLTEARKNGIHTPAIVISSSELPPGDLAAAGAFLFLPKHEMKLLPDFARRLLGSRAD